MRKALPGASIGYDFGCAAPTRSGDLVGVPPTISRRRRTGTTASDVDAPHPVPTARVVIVGPRPPQVGGVETFLLALLESRALQRFDVVHVDTSKHRPKSTQGRFDAANFVWAARHFGQFASALVRHRPHVVYVTVAGSLAGVLRDTVICRLARLHPGTRVIGHQHASGVEHVLARRGPLGAWVRFGLTGCHRMLVLGTPWQAIFGRWEPALPVSVCPPAAAARLVEHGWRFDRPRPVGPLRALFVGQIGDGKGVPQMVRAIHVLREAGRDVTLTLVGVDAYPGAIESTRALVRELGIESRVRFEGRATGHVLHEHYRRHHVFLLPSFHEGVPLVLIEAGAFALPVVATPVGCVPDLVHHDRTGLVVPVGEVEPLAAAIARLDDDRALAERLGRGLRESTRAYHPERVAAMIAEVFDEELAAAGAERAAMPHRRADVVGDDA